MAKLFNLMVRIIKPFMNKGYSKTMLGKFIYKYLFLKLKPEYIHINGIKLYVPTQDISTEKMMINREYEPIETRCIKNNINEGDIVVDIGGNIGYYAILSSKIVGKNGKVYAFEPNEEIIPLLKKNLKINSCKNVFLVNKAVSDKNGKLNFYIMKQNKAQSSIYCYGEIDKKIQVDSITLDKFFILKNKPNFIKMDVEGGELSILKGAKSILKNKIKIFLEHKPSKLKRQGINPNEIKKILIRNKFKIKRLPSSLFCEK